VSIFKAILMPSCPCLKWGINLFYTANRVMINEVIISLAVVASCSRKREREREGQWESSGSWTFHVQQGGVS